MGNSCAISSSRLSYLSNTLPRCTSRVVWVVCLGSFVILVYLPDSQKSKCIAYGGEDQKIAMASKPGKDVTVEVKTSGTKSTSSRSKSRGRNRNVKITVNSQPKANRRRRNRPNNRGRKRVEAVVKRQLDKAGVTGPRPAITQTATSTLGTIGPNCVGLVVLELATFMNPCLVKESTASNSFGPIQASAAQNNPNPAPKADVRLTPMVGPSAISGTLENTAGTPSSTGWSGLGARKHKDVKVGSMSVFTITARDMAGPREGWFVTNTNESGGESVGPTIELHSLGETQSTYQNQRYTGPVFLVELHCTWQFSNYSANPALAQLEKGEDKDAQIKFEGTAGQPLTMTVAPHSAFARGIETRSTVPYSGAAGESTSDTIWQIASTAVDAASVVVPPPFNWLIKGGWWFVKKLAGRSREGEIQLQVFASYEDAQNNRPAICTGPVSGTNPSRLHNVKFVQMNAPSTGMPPESSLGAYSIPIPDTPGTITDDFKLVASVNQQYQQNPPCPTYCYRPENKVVVKIGDHYDEVNFFFKVTPPHIFLVGGHPYFQTATKPEALDFMEIGQKSNTIYLKRGVIWGYSQHKVVSGNNQSILTFYLGQLQNQIRYANYKQVRYQFTGSGSTTSLQPISGEFDLQFLDLTAGPWYILASVHLVNSSQRGYVATENITRPTIVCPPAAKNLFVCTGSDVASTMVIDFIRTPPTFTQSTEQSLYGLPQPIEDGFLPDSEDENLTEDDSLLDDDDFFPASDQQVFSSRQVLFRAMVNDGWPEDQAERLAKRALPTLSEKELRDEFLVGLADGFSPRQAAANAREKCSRGHAE
ncbi:capsid precursor [Mamastrovirus 5]|uniref:Capsid polyprotein VP90 n=1 Tax=Mamastrovirus 5 TaxID=1239569 RepID=A0A343X9Z8_9VIRU|nr:capsid precursor [Mamastrovirus 5]